MAQRRWTSTASISSGTPPWNAVSSRYRLTSRASKIPFQILRGIKSRYEEHHHLIITDEAVKAAAELAARYVTDRFLPDKAIDLIDEAASRVRMHRSSSPPTLKEALRGLDSIRKEKEGGHLRPNSLNWLPTCATAKTACANGLPRWNRSGRTSRRGEKPYVTEEDIAEIVSMWTGIPLMRIAGEESERLLDMRDELHKRIIGQEEAIDKVAKAVQRSRAGVKDPKRPIGSFMFLGPTGVGKTELAKALAEFMFGSEASLIKIDMSEFMERHNVSRLVGAPPGYVGYEEGGQLTEAVRRKSVLAWCCSTKSRKPTPKPLICCCKSWKMAICPMRKGRRVDFRNTIIIMTSNVGAEFISRNSDGAGL